MTRAGFAFLIAFGLCGGAVSSFAQVSEPAAPAGFIGDDAAKPHAKKNVHKNGAPAKHSAQQNSEEADKAARLAEGRKKFFERSMGFDNGGGSNSPITFGGSSGLSPTGGFKF